MNIDLDPGVLAELEYLVELHREHGAPNPCESVDSLIRYVLASVADGSRRPGSWERGMLDSMGLVANTDRHREYRAKYGRPDGGDTTRPGSTPP